MLCVDEASYSAVGWFGAALTLPFVARQLLESSVLLAWRLRDRAALDRIALIDAENSHGHHCGIALLADAQGLTLLGSTRRGRDQAWLLRLSLRGELQWERQLSELDDPRLLTTEGEGYLIVGSHNEHGDAGRSFAATIQPVQKDGVPFATRVHPPGGVSTFLAYTELAGRRYLGGANGYKGRIAELRADLTLAWDRELPELFQISCLVPYGSGLLGLGAATYNTRGPQAGRILLIDAEGKIKSSVSAYPQGFGHLLRAARLSDGRIIAIGRRQDQDLGPIQGWVAELDEQGVIHEQCLFGSDLTAVCSLPQGGYAVAGVALGEKDPSLRQVIIRRCLPGQPPHNLRLGLEVGVWVDAMVALSDSSLVLLGMTTRLGAGKTNLWVAGVDANDSVMWEHGFGTA